MNQPDCLDRELKKLSLSPPPESTGRAIRQNLLGEMKSNTSAKKSKFWILPVIASAAAILLAILLLRQKPEQSENLDAKDKRPESHLEQRMANMDLAQSRFLGLRDGKALLQIKDSESQKTLSLGLGESIYGHQLKSIGNQYICLTSDANEMLYLYCPDKTEK